MQEIGRITKITGTTVTIQGGELGGCFGCMNEECKANGKVFTAENRRGLDLKLGELVEINVSAGATASNAFLVLLPPIVAFILFFALVAVLFPGASEAARASGGVLGLVLGFFGVYFFRKAKPAKDVPVVTRTINETEPPADD